MEFFLFHYEWHQQPIVLFYTSGKGPSEIVRTMKEENVNRMMVYRTIKRYKETCSFENKPRPGRPTSVRTRKLKNVVRCRISRNPRRSMRKMACELKVGRESLRNLVRIDLGLKSLKRRNNTFSHQLFERNGSKDAGAFYGGSDEIPMTNSFFSREIFHGRKVI